MNIYFIIRGEEKPALSPNWKANCRRSSLLSVRGNARHSEEGLSGSTRRLWAELFCSSSFRMFKNHFICGHRLNQIKKKNPVRILSHKGFMRCFCFVLSLPTLFEE